MKESLFQLLLNLFEKSLTNTDQLDYDSEEASSEEKSKQQAIFVANAQDTSMRVLNDYEIAKLTKSSLRFLQQIINYKILPAQAIEEILHQIETSDSSYVTLDEVKWLIREKLLNTLEPSQQTFVDLILESEDNGQRH